MNHILLFFANSSQKFTHFLRIAIAIVMIWIGGLKDIFKIHLIKCICNTSYNKNHKKIRDN